MREIPLTKGYVAIVDDEDYNRLMGTSWYALISSNLVYAARRVTDDRGRRIQLMHRLLLGEPDGLQVDHENHNGLDNQRSNLRIATYRQNQGNSRKNKSATSIYKGVYWSTPRSRWDSEITKPDGKKQHLGSFNSEVLAAKAYNESAMTIFGSFAHLNEITS